MAACLILPQHPPPSFPSRKQRPMPLPRAPAGQGWLILIWVPGALWCCGGWGGNWSAGGRSGHPGATVADQRHALRRLARFAGITVVTPEQDLRGPGLIPLVTPMHHAIWDLSGDLRAGMAGQMAQPPVWGGTGGAADHGVAPISCRRLVERRGRPTRLPAATAHIRRNSPFACHRKTWCCFNGVMAGHWPRAWSFVVDGGSASYHLGWAGMRARAVGVHGLMLYRAALALRAMRVCAGWIWGRSIPKPPPALPGSSWARAHSCADWAIRCLCCPAESLPFILAKILHGGAGV